LSKLTFEMHGSPEDYGGEQPVRFKTTEKGRGGMKKWFSFMMVFAIAGTLFASANEYEVKGKAGGYNLTVKMEGNPPSRGQNNMTITITDGASKPITDARVLVEYLMPSLPGRRPMMDYTADAVREGNLYKARINLSMAGEWVVEIKMTRAGKSDSMKFSFILH
jgi:hypothetical protein